MAKFPKIEDTLHPKYGEKHDCPACNSPTKRRIRVYPTFGTEDARCDRCVNTNKWPEQEKGVKHGSTEAHQADQARQASEADSDQASLI